MAIQAGAHPNRSPDNTEAANVKSNIGMFKVRSASEGRIPTGMMACIPRSKAHPSATPTTPPKSASARFSVRNCANTVWRDAPSAARKATSFCRVVPLANSRLAIFTQAISSTKPTAPRSIHSMLISSLGRKSLCSNSTTAPHPLLLLGFACAMFAVTVSMLACACFSVTPSLSRPIASNQ